MGSRKDQGENLNLPDGISQLYQRRYSDPGRSRNTAEEDMARSRPRRFSLTSFDDLKDISSGKVRSSVNKILHTSGFTASAKAKSNQMRRYSVHVDPNVQNNLGDKRQRSGSSFFHRSMSHDGCCSPDQIKSRDEHVKLSKTFLRKRSLTTYMSKDPPQDELPKPFSRTNDVEAPPTYFCNRFQSKRCHSDASECPTFPKCKYKLRDDGRIASEMVSAFGVHIEEASVCTTRNNAHGSSVNAVSPDGRRSETPLRRDQSIIRKFSSSSMSGHRPKSGQSRRLTATPSVPDEMSTDSMSLPGEWQAAVKPASRLLGSRYSFVTDNVPGYHEPVMKRKDSLLSRKPKITFEVIGSENLHGSPLYSGRLKLCTFRHLATE